MLSIEVIRLLRTPVDNSMTGKYLLPLYRIYTILEDSSEFFRVFDSQRKVLEKCAWLIAGCCHDFKKFANEQAIMRDTEKHPGKQKVIQVQASTSTFEGYFFQLTDIANQVSLPVYFLTKLDNFKHLERGQFIIISQPAILYSKNPSRSAYPIAFLIEDSSQMLFIGERPPDFAMCQEKSCRTPIQTSVGGLGVLKCKKHLQSFLKGRPSSRPELAFEFSSALNVPESRVEKGFRDQSSSKEIPFIYGDYYLSLKTGSMTLRIQEEPVKRMKLTIYKDAKDFQEKRKAFQRSLSHGSHLLEPTFPNSITNVEESFLFMSKTSLL